MVVARGQIARARRQGVDISERHPEFAVEDQVQSAEPGRSHTHNRVRLAGKRRGLSQDLGVPGKLPSPEAIAEHYDRLSLLVASETSAEAHANLRDVKVVCRRCLSPE